MSTTTAFKKPTNLSMDFELLKEARELKINLSKAAEEGLRHEVTRVKATLWKRENALAIESSNKWVEANGLPLDQYRQF